MKESTKQILITEKDSVLQDTLFGIAEQEFMDDPDWEDNEPRIFNVTTINESNEQISKKYKVSIVFDPYFSIKTEEYHD